MNPIQTRLLQSKVQVGSGLAIKYNLWFNFCEFLLVFATVNGVLCAN